jgi:tetratricopeptide (TPR) repeat protein
MNGRQAKIALVISASFALTGCHAMQALFGFRSQQPAPMRAMAPATGSAIEQATEEGRRQLGQGQTGLAIESFQRALSMGPPTAPALNGMGVAFARLGRFEVAERLFQEAMVLDPADSRYASNLALLMRSPALAMRHDGDIAAAAALSAEPGKTSSVAVAAAEPRPGQLVRVGGHEYHIQTLTPSDSLPRAAVAVAKHFKPLVRIDIAKPAADAPAKAASDDGDAAGKADAKASGEVTILNPHARVAGKVGSRFVPLVRLQFASKQAAARQPEKIAEAGGKMTGGGL